MGGYAALAFAVRHPARLAALVLCDTRAGGRQRRDRSRARRRDRAHPDDRLRARTSTAAWRGCSRRRRRPALVTFLRAHAETRAASLIAGIEALRDRPDRTGELGGDCAVPTLVVRGADDQVTPADDMQTMAAAIAGATFVPIPGAGHLSHVEAPGRVRGGP